MGELCKSDLSRTICDRRRPNPLRLQVVSQDRSACRGSRVYRTRLPSAGRPCSLPLTYVGPEFDFHMLQKPQHFSFEGRTISTWRLHLYLPPACAQDAAYGLLNGSREASHAMCLEHQPSTVASKRRKIHLRIETGASLHRRLGQRLGRHEAQKPTVEAKDGRATEGRREHNDEEATGLTTERAMPMRRMAAMPSIEAPGTQEIAIEVLLTLLTKPRDPKETETGHLLAFPPAGMPIPKRILASRRSRDLTMKVFGRTATTLGFSQRALDLNVLETSLRLETSHHLETNLHLEGNLHSGTGLRLVESLHLEISLLSREALGLHQREKRTPLMLSTGAPVLRVVETEAPRSTEAIGLREMNSAIPPGLSAEVRAMEIEAHPTEAPSPSTATASSMTTSQWPYHIPVPQANGCMVLTLLWQRCAETHASSTN
jgi:hypothetical protein